MKAIKLIYTIRTIISICFLQVAAIAIFAQSYKYEYEHFTIENGLPHKRVLDLAFDKEGVMWISTPSGIVTYDGNEFNLLPDIYNKIVFQEIEFDRNGKLWLRSNRTEHNIPSSEKLIIYDPITNQAFSAIDKIPGAEQYMTPRNNFHLWSDNTNNIFIKDQNNHELLYYQGDSLKSSETKEITSYYLSVNLKQSGQFCYSDDDTLRKTNITNQLTQQYNIPYNRIPIFYENELVLTYGPIDNNKYASLVNRNGDTILKSSRIFIQYTKSKDDIYITDTKALLSYNPEKETLTDINKDLGGIFDHNDIFNIYSNNDVIWVSANEGLYKIVRTIPLFNKALSGYGQSARNIFDLKDNNILVGTESGLVKINLKTGEETLWLTGFNCYTITPIDEYRYILGSFAVGASIWDIRKPNNVKNVFPFETNAENTPLKAAYIFYHIDHKNQLWLVSRAAIFKFDLDNNSLECVNPNGDNNKVYGAIFPDPIDKNKILLSRENGLDQLDISTFDIKSFEGLEGINVTDINITEIDSSICWISSKYDGLIKWEYGKEIIENFLTTDGLKSNNVHATFSDMAGNIWMSTDLGLSMLEKSTKKVTTLTTVNGLHENEFNKHSHLSLGDSILIFGGVDGITYFKPNEANKELYNTLTKIHGIQYTDQRNGIEKIENLKSETSTIRLKKHQLNPKLMFTKTYNRASTTIKYINPNVNTNWQYSQNNIISLSGLSEGENTILISRQQGINKWSKPKTIKIVKPISILKNIWFYIVGISIFSFLLIMYLGKRNKESEELNKKIRKQVEEKTLELSRKNEILEKANELNADLFDIIGHDLRSPITSLTNITKSFEYLTKNGNPEDTIKLGKTVEKNAKKLLITVDKLIKWSRLKKKFSDRIRKNKP